MTERQRFALANAIDPDDISQLVRFAQTVKRRGQSFGTILTVDERRGFWWHVSVSVLSVNSKPLLMSSLTFGERKIAERLARELIAGVGGPLENVRQDDQTFQIIRRLRPDEEKIAGSGPWPPR